MYSPFVFHFYFFLNVLSQHVFRVWIELFASRSRFISLEKLNSVVLGFEVVCFSLTFFF